MTKYFTTPADRLWPRVDRSGGPDTCWTWQGKRTPPGYGAIAILVNGVRTYPYTHRFAWELTHGPIPDGLFVLHHCDNPPCCNPSHLFLGTHDDNAKDRMKKNRSYSARRDRSLKLTLEQVGEIRHLRASTSMTQAEIGARFEVSGVQVCRILNGAQWRRAS